MHRIATIPLFTLVVTLVPACGGAAGDGFNTQGEAETAASTPSNFASLEAKAKRDAFEALDAAIGPFVRGESLVYDGTFEAKDNLSAAEDVPDDVLPEGPAIASLVFDADATGNPRVGLTVTSRTDGSHLELFQAIRTPHDAQVGFPGSQFTSFASSGSQSCTECLADLANRPSYIHVDLSANGLYPAQFGFSPIPSLVTASGDLSVRSAASLTFADLRVLTLLRGALSGFVPHGTEVVDTVTNAIFAPAPVPPHTSHLACSTETDYHVDRFIESLHPARFGVRNFRVDQPITVCCDSPEACGG